MKRLLARFVRQSPAMVVAMVALFVALSGTAVATTSALIGGNQIRNSSIAGIDIKNNSLTGADVKNKSLTAADFKGAVRGARGAAGTPGPPGPQGGTGPAGAPNPNADTLNGYAANGLVRVARATPSGVALGTADAVLSTLNLTAPSAGFVLIQANYNIIGTGCRCQGWFFLKDAVSNQQMANYKILSADVDSVYESSSLEFVFPVNAGARSFQLIGKRVGATTTSIDAPVMTALFVPFGSTGAGTLATGPVADSGSSTE